MSACGQFGFVAIFFIGSVFSPYYAAMRRQGAADPRDHVAVNIALYGPRGPIWSPGWAMTERGRDALETAPDRIRIGASSVTFTPRRIEILIDEVTAPLPRRLHGRIVLTPAAWVEERHALDPEGRHCWTPLAPGCEVALEFSRPALRWNGHGYLDGNHGAVPLERDFIGWDWSRLTMPDGACQVFYEAARRDGSRFWLARRFGADGSAVPTPLPARVRLPGGLWRLERATHADTAPTRIRPMEAAPFYSRAMLEVPTAAGLARGVTESLSLRRFSNPIVQAMLPYRMPR